MKKDSTFNNPMFYLDGTPEQNRVPCEVTDRVLERCGGWGGRRYTSYFDLAVEYLEWCDIVDWNDINHNHLREELVWDVSSALCDEGWYTADADLLADLMIIIIWRRKYAKQEI